MTIAAQDKAFALLEARSPVGLGLWDTELRFLRVNPALAEINGMTPEEHVGRALHEVVHPDLAEAEARVLQRVLDTGEPVLDRETTGETQAQPGVTRHWRASYFPVDDDDGQRLGVGGIVVEVTQERRESVRAERAVTQAERATRRAETANALLDAVFDAAPVGLGLWSPDGRYERINEALAAINGAPLDEHLGRTPEDVLGDLGAQIGALVRQVAATRTPVLDRELSGRTPAHTDEIQYRRASYFPLLGEGGDVLGVGGVVRDITDEHVADAERARLLRDALTARAQAQAAEVRAQAAQAEAEAARRRVEFLSAAGARMLASMADYETTLQEIARLAVPAVADWCAVAVRRPDGRIEVPAVVHRDPERQQVAARTLARFPVTASDQVGLGKVIATGRPELLNGIEPEALPGIDPEAVPDVERMGVRSLLTVPLRTPTATVGAIALGFAESARRFTADDQALAEGLASRAALALENARLYRERSHIARTLQRSLLPARLPEIPGLELAARYRAAGEENEVGGDFYDAFPSEGGTWTVIIGDVVGKGPEAAALTSLARHTLRAAALRAESPIANLELLNAALRTSMEHTEHFCTVAYARVCPREGFADVTLANGGHVPPVVVRADGSVDFVSVRGTLIGAFDDPILEQGEVRLGPGDAVLLYTDGVTEIRTQDAEFGERQLVDTLRAHAGHGAGEIVAAVERAAVDAQDGDPRDDIALLALRVPSAER